MSPRLSIIPGDFATDPRADVGHFRVLNLVGRHTNDSGWCRVKQITIATEVGLTRETVNRKIKDLVDWGYVEKDAQDATGRSIWYRTILDRPVPPPQVHEDQPEAQDAAGAAEMHSSEAGGGPVSGGSHAGYNQDDELHPTCDRTDHTRCDRTHAHQNDFLNESPPLPPDGGGSAGDDVLQKVKALRPHDPAITHLLAPLLERRRVSSADPVATLAQACATTARLGFTAGHLAKVLEILLRADVKVIKAERLAAAIEAVRKGGLMLVIAKGSPEFAAWLRHFEAAKPNLAALMAREGKWQVPTRFPPQGAPRAADAAAPDSSGKGAAP